MGSRVLLLLIGAFNVVAQDKMMWTWTNPPKPQDAAQKLSDSLWVTTELTVGGDINLLWQLCYIDLEAVLNVVQSLRIILVWHKGDGQTFGPEPSSTRHLRYDARNKSSNLALLCEQSF